MQETPVRVKGTPVRSFLAFLDQELSEAEREEVFAKVRNEESERLRKKQVLATEYVPVALLNRITEEGARVKREPLEAFARRAGRFAAREAVSTVLRLVLRVFTPDALLQRAGSIWKSVYDRGELRAVKEGDRRARTTLVDFPSEPAGCARITGWIEEMARMTGEKNIAVEQVRCYSKGAPACEWLITWGQ